MSDDFVNNGVPTEGDKATGTPGADWLLMAREAHTTSRTWFDTTQRKRVENALAHASNRHAATSKFYSPDYDKRSKLFRPKTRSMMRKQDAAAAVAFFSTSDVVNCEATNENDPNQVTAADVHRELLNYRLHNSIPWFRTVMGAMFDAQTQGVVVSCQEWRYRETETTSDEVDEQGNPTGHTVVNTEVLEDRPWIRLVPLENLKIHPSCDWTDPINSSPFLIEEIPYYANELAERISHARQYGSQVPYIREFTEAELLSGGSTSTDMTTASVRMAREPARVDRYSQVNQGTKFRPIWVHRNIVRIKGLDYVYETLGTTLLLSTPVPIEDVFGIRRRPYVMGSIIIEPHRPLPSSPVELAGPVQESMNELLNQRRDNIQLALNNRYLVRRGQMVDLRSLMRNVAGSVTLTTDPSADIKQLDTKDVTSSSYQEQDRLNQDFDDLTGVFTQSSVGSNREMNETVGGMDMLGQGADMVTELGLRTLCETWAEPVLKQIVELNRLFETDQTALQFVSDQTDTNTWMEAFRLLAEPTNCTVSVGFGSTDPTKRIQKIQAGVQMTTQMFPDMAQTADRKEVCKEVWGALGFRDGARFFPGLKSKEDPQVTAIKKQLEQVQQELQEAQDTQKTAMQIAQIRATSAENIAHINALARSNAQQAADDARKYIAGLQSDLKMADQKIAQEGNDLKRGQLLLQREALSNAIMNAERDFQLEVATNPAIPEQNRANLSPAASESTLADSLQHPSSEQFITDLPHHNGAKDLPVGGSNDRAGVIQRGQYGEVPGAEG